MGWAGRGIRRRGRRLEGTLRLSRPFGRVPCVYEPAHRTRLPPPMTRRRSAVRRQRVDVDSDTVSVWFTSGGGVFSEPVHRPPTTDDSVTLRVVIPSRDYKLLELLFDDVPTYVSRLTHSHVTGLIKSAKYNRKNKV